MFDKTILSATAAALLAAWSSPSFAQAEDQKAWPAACKDWDEWDTPGPPFKVYGNTYYVGTCGIGAILIAGEKHHVLIDGGTEAGGRLIAANIGRLGYDIADIRFLLSSHEHHDHAGGLAYLQQASGAIMLTSRAAGAVLASGNAGADGPQAGINPPLPRIEIGAPVEDGDTINLRELKVTALATPGHTPGAMSWQWQSCEAGDCKTIVYADSLSPVSSDTYRFSDHPDYVAAYRASIAKVAALDCDILLTPHPSASGMREKLLAGELSGGMTCRAYAESVGQRLDARLAEEAAAAQ
jgi:metallo-beta-lactamase class B